MDNQSSDELLLLQQLVYSQLASDGDQLKETVVVLTCLLFIYINSLMFHTLLSKPVFRELPRYILFAHMLCNDTIQMVLTVVLFCLVVEMIQISKPICAVAVYISTVTYRNTAFNIAVMSLERYVAICFPLRHSEMATPNATGVAIGTMWVISSVCPLIDIFYGMIMDPMYYSAQIFCFREMYVITSWQMQMFQIMNGFYFVSVTLVIIVTYINVIVAAHGVSADKKMAQKAKNTILLHIIQLILCLSSLLFGTIDTILARYLSGKLLHQLRFVVFFFILLLPRFLSPLIYGLRDDAVGALFLYYIRCGYQKVKPSVTTH
ncbi:odorant receptor 131-2-like [Engraulis encrasicolus]|uniref:odorant receptor 131-2-like n=1 Tax=Engraulis encrasicolus TaxID=184585 RepID=UPI002FD5EACF